jgi:hypothetical protein
MNPFSVDWSKNAINDLAVAWLNAADQPAVARATARIDYLLERDPLHAGQHLEEGLYKLAIDPLTVFYEIDVQNRAVEVTALWYRS